MSTRSGRRIHSSNSENVERVSEILVERKTRSKSVKQSDNEVATAKKKKNFVRRASDDEVDILIDKSEKPSKSVSKSRRHTLKLLNIPAVDYDVLTDGKSMRQSRRIRNEDKVETINVNIPENSGIDNVKKRNKKRKKAVIENSENEPVEAVIVTKKKISTKKKILNSFIVEDFVLGEHKSSFNKSNVSIDSFHSAAGSPDKNIFNKEEAKKGNKMGNNKVRKESSSFPPSNSVENLKDIKKKRKKLKKDTNFGTSIDESCKLNTSQNSSESSVYKNEKVEVKDENRNEKKVLDNFTTKAKIKDYKEATVSGDFKNTYAKAESINSMALNNSIEISIKSTELNTPNQKRKSSESKNINNTSKSSLDFVNISLSNETINGIESISPSNNSFKKRRMSTLKNSTSDKTDTSSTLSNGYAEEKIDNLVTKIENATSLQKPRKSSTDTSYEKNNLSDANVNHKENNNFNINSTADKELSVNKRSSSRKSSVKNTTYDKNEDNNLDMDTTFNKEPSISCNIEVNSSAKKSRISFQRVENSFLNGTYDRMSDGDRTSLCNNTYDKPKLDATFERTKDSIDGHNITNLNPKLSIISSDDTYTMTSDRSEELSRISITSDDSRTENIVNTTPLLIESSMDQSQINSPNVKLNKTATPKKEDIVQNKTPDEKGNLSYNNITPIRKDVTLAETKTPPLKRDGTYTEFQNSSIKNHPTTLQREGTFTKESPEVPFPKLESVDKTPKGRVTLNVTHSIEKPQNPSRLTKVMFRSPVDDPIAVKRMRGKLIKSNLKGSNRSFVFDESSSETSRRRSRTQGCDDEAAGRGRHARLADSRSRTISATARLQVPSEPPNRTKLPNFAALHRKQFSKMESLDECQRRRARRAKELLTPTKTKPTDVTQSPKRPDTPKSKEIDKKNQNYTRFGFKLNLDVNPFSFPTKTTDGNPKDLAKPKALKRQATLPSLAGTTLRKEAAKQTVMREKMFSDRRDLDRSQNRTVIKGVRTNRRFELQMKMRNID